VPTPDDFQALARSSPWRFRALHFRHRDRDRTVEAWLHRPGRLLVRHPERGDTVETGVPYSRGWVSMGEGKVSRPVPVHPHDAVPQLCPDGLVARRPDDPAIEWDDPIYGSYQWVAMLDPVELSHHVSVSEVRETERAGRPTWWAHVEAAPGYEPRCGCCALLWSEISEVDEQVVGAPTVRATDPDVTYPDGYEIGLDLETGVVVSLRPVGGDHAHLWFEVDVVAVDSAVAPVEPVSRP
jgi:hypothetical protein